MNEKSGELNLSGGEVPGEEGVVEKRSLGYDLIFHRFLNHPVEKVWKFLTEPELLKTWLANARIDLKTGGTVELRYENTGYVVKGTITRIESMEMLEYTWWAGDEPESLLRWQLSKWGTDGCYLRLHHTFEHKCDLPKVLSGWHVHLNMIDPALSGQPAEWSWENWEKLKDRYTMTTQNM